MRSILSAGIFSSGDFILQAFFMGDFILGEDFFRTRFVKNKDKKPISKICYFTIPYRDAPDSDF